MMGPDGHPGNWELPPMMLICFMVTNRAWKSCRYSEAFACPVSWSFTCKSLGFPWFLSLLCTQIFVLVQDPNTPHSNPYACPGSQLFTRKSLFLSSFPTIQRTPQIGEDSRLFQDFLRLAQAPDSSHANPYAFPGS
ncbi:hypothetical protein O181_047862 [Austropuccinia psidii MF-1]|uniref:Uncharacterized protein n=1 Tax=Austropuccinia psidii MF-1 TaxID=1389203 RepID=A0A9Q3DU02_9BASI|nr:hypothetical protein [Austropuccinia psidii MF-1]